ncbi:signal peptidase II [Pendulispora rubella]|uniref:Lipoprotein signal peptidase n=1 Tax=Pendulispora rubella TaxID=2741070 RepID=A0ABZ2KSM6_9BACT
MRSRLLLFVRCALSLLFAGALVGCDHATKSLAQRELQEGRIIELISGVLDLRYTENHDTAFSLLRDVSIPHKATVLSVVASVVLLGTLASWWRRRHAAASEGLGYALVAAGAVGNIADRFARGFVVDFIHLKHWPVFNVADILIVGGILLLALHAILGRGPNANQSAPHPS